jgi:hypothetical protein
VVVCCIQDGIQFHEMYDMDADPFQLHNVYNTLGAGMKATLHARLDALHHCQGESCP